MRPAPTSLPASPAKPSGDPASVTATVLPILFEAMAVTRDHHHAVIHKDIPGIWQATQHAQQLYHQLATMTPEEWTPADRAALRPHCLAWHRQLEQLRAALELATALTAWTHAPETALSPSTVQWSG